jgi:hypothetical protein
MYMLSVLFRLIIHGIYCALVNKNASDLLAFSYFKTNFNTLRRKHTVAQNFTARKGSIYVL